MSDSKFMCKVSSTINKDVKNFGKQFMFDQNDETCWNSDEGDSQWILLKYEETKQISSIQIQFQGGFGAEQCVFESIDDSGTTELSEILYFENNNLLQTKKLSKRVCAKIIKLNFIKCYDTFGRIIIYTLNLNSEA